MDERLKSTLDKIQWLGHASFRINGGKTIYIDPWKLPDGVGGDGGRQFDAGDRPLGPEGFVMGKIGERVGSHRKTLVVRHDPVEPRPVRWR